MSENAGELDLFAVTAPGLERLAAAELNGLGITANAEDGGAGWRGDVASMMRANVHLRTATRVIARAGVFRARTFHELERRSAKLPWHRFLRPGPEVELRVTTRKSKLYHQGAVAERLARILADVAGVHVAAARTAADEEERSADASQLIVVRVLRDVCTISVDTSGALLHQRGYRQAVAKAPLRETIAAAMLYGAGWRADTPLLDPMCGSGTIAIEAALLLRGIAPGLASANREPRGYAFQAWPDHDARMFGDVVAAARASIRDSGDVAILAADSHGGAIAAARSNAERAGVTADIRFERRRVEDLAASEGQGHLVTNPPYGVRVGDRRELAALYAGLGRLARERLPGWTVALLAAEEKLFLATGLDFEEAFATRNGGIPVRLLVSRVPR